MKAEVNEKDVVKYWGIWLTNKEDGISGWMHDSDTIIVSFDCPRVANAQYDLLQEYGLSGLEAEVREIS